jgi:hypothetical protein
MDTAEKQMVQLLTDLRDDYGVDALKASFEDEGSRMEEVMRLINIASSVDLGVILKIGGAEAIRDLFDAMTLGVSGIVAPMVESPYALTKFITAVTKHVPASQDIRFAVNIETIQACQCFTQMLRLPGMQRLAWVTIGRVDLCGSLNLSRGEINSGRIYEVVRDVCRQAKEVGLCTTLGGGITKEAVPFIQRLVGDGLLDRFETRQIIFLVGQGIERAMAGLVMASKFELLWLSNKHDRYSSIAQEDDERIEMLKGRSS